MSRNSPTDHRLSQFKTRVGFTSVPIGLCPCRHLRRTVWTLGAPVAYGNGRTQTRSVRRKSRSPAVQWDLALHQGFNMTHLAHTHDRLQKPDATSQAGLKSWLRRGAKPGAVADAKLAADGGESLSPAAPPAQQQQQQQSDGADPAGQQAAKGGWISRISGAYSSAGAHSCLIS